MKNWNCDGAKCKEADGEVRRMPLGGHAAIIVCQACYEYEITYRKERNKELERRNRFPLPSWESLEI